MATNMKENGFETMIVKYLVENNHYEEGSNSDYNKIYAIDEVRLFRFLHDTQDEKLAELRIEDNEIEKKKFLDRLSKKISDDGVINIIRKGMKYKNKTVDFYMVRPSEGNQEAKESYDKNIFSVTRQLRYSNDYGRLALDVCIFLNGLPIITMELKNQITKQNHDDAIRQYMTDRTPDELLFQFKRCIVHFAVDDDEIYMEDVELESYRLVAQDTISIKLEDKDSEIEPIPVKTDVGIPVPELDTLSNILASFHEMWGNCEWTDEDRIRKQIAELPDIVEQDETYQNAMKYSDAQNARDESDRATYDAILKSLVSGTELYKAFSDDIRNKNNQSFKKWLLDYVFNVTYKPESRE